ncbi:MAG: hypothetical protein HRU11_11860 [Parvularculaceae bacterium]|nr:hypothetical protein [Parvularculaceae bacterium]
MTKPSWAFWVVGILATLFNLFGLFDMFMTLSNNQAYLAAYTPEQIAYWQGLPWWRLAMWVVGIGSGVVGVVTFWMRKKITAKIWLIGPVMILTGMSLDSMGGILEVMSAGEHYGANIVLTALILLFCAYAYRQGQKGVFS